MPVADFYRQLMGVLDELGLATPVWTMPVEIPGAIPFDVDHTHTAYDAAQATRFWRALVQMDRVFERFRARFLGKVSPVHLFWGALDLAVTRFSGRPAPPHPGGAPELWPARDARGVLPRGQQRGLLARARRRGRLLLLRLPRAARVPRRRPRRHRGHATTRRSGSSSSRTASSARPTTPTPSCCASSRPRTRPPPTPPAGIGLLSNADQPETTWPARRRTHPLPGALNVDAAASPRRRGEPLTLWLERSTRSVSAAEPMRRGTRGCEWLLSSS